MQNPKLQTPNSKQPSKLKSQKKPFSGQCGSFLEFGFWNLFRIWLLGFGILLSACAVGTNYHAPKTPLPSGFANAARPGLPTQYLLAESRRDLDYAKRRDLISLF